MKSVKTIVCLLSGLLVQSCLCSCQNEPEMQEAEPTVYGTQFFISFDADDHYMDFPAEGGEITIQENPSAENVAPFTITYITRVTPKLQRAPNPSDKWSAYRKELYFDDLTEVEDDPSTLNLWRNAIKPEIITYDVSVIESHPGQSLTVKMPENTSTAPRVFYIIASSSPARVLNAVRVTQNGAKTPDGHSILP